MPVVGVAVGAVVGAAPLPVFVELPPQAAKNTSALSATRQHKIGFIFFLVVGIRVVIDLFNCIFSSFGKVLHLLASKCQQYYLNCDHLL
jgi:hypothetical protein